MAATRHPIPGFWELGPHDALPVERTWRDFVKTIGGSIVDELVPPPRNFQNADFIFLDSGTVIELKEVATEFSGNAGVFEQYLSILRRIIADDPTWRPVSHGGTSEYPPWVLREFVRVFRPPISRILKKANRQLRETKRHFDIRSPTGIVLFANDGFTTLAPELILALVYQLLLHSYSSVDCFVYLTVNRYVEVPGSRSPRLLWVPSCSTRAPESLHSFVNDLSRKWFDFLEEQIGPFMIREETEASEFTLHGVRAIVLPEERSALEKGAAQAVAEFKKKH